MSKRALRDLIQIYIVEEKERRKQKKVQENLCQIVVNEDEFKFNECFQKLLDIHYGNDDYQWKSSVNNKDFT